MTGDPCPSVWAHFPALPRTPPPLGTKLPDRSHDTPRHAYEGRHEHQGHRTGSGVKCAECARHVVTSGAKFCVEHEPES